MTLGRTKKESAAFNSGPTSPSSPVDTSDEYMSASILSMRSIQLSQDIDGRENSEKGVSTSELALSAQGRVPANQLIEAPSGGVKAMASVRLSRGDLDDEYEMEDDLRPRGPSEQPRFRAVSPKHESPTLAIQAMQSVRLSSNDLCSDVPEVYEKPVAEPQMREMRRSSKGDNPTLAIQAMRSVRLSSKDLRGDVDAYDVPGSKIAKLEWWRSSKDDSPTLAIQAMRSVKLSAGDLRREPDSDQDHHARPTSEKLRSALSSKGDTPSTAIQAMRSVRLSSGDLRRDEEYHEEPLSKSVKTKRANTPGASFEISSSNGNSRKTFMLEKEHESLGVKAMASVRLSHNRLDDDDDSVYYHEVGISRGPSSTRISRTSSGRSQTFA
ncbi:hypothetical protein BJ742DRAFT_832368 [Cladochytrium replicatum]|nr:hypothetical protein BJ742DRAFT_832368 [Cladochytrium replicatum]